ncbi:hypothetical protein BH10PAT1_BH10PAT1_1450 [soil metagenome]
MKANEVREEYLKFFEKHGHKIIKPAPLVLKDDPTTLFTSSGMQPLVPYLMGEKYPGNVTRLVNSQPSLRAQDIEEVGDNRHTTFFEMLGNWSLGDYFKKEQLSWIWEFLTEELGLPADKIHVTLFEGYENIPKDEETYKLWKNLGIPDERIHYYGNKNWWSRAGGPDQMPEGEIGGPDSEMFFEFEEVKHDKKYGDKCHPQCDCGRFIEIGNSVFIQYRKVNGELVELPQKNVDFGGGLERLTAATLNTPDIFETDLFKPVIEEIERISGKKYEDFQSVMRIITDHTKASVFLINDGVIPGNKLQSYVLRRLLRRAATKAYQMDPKFGDSNHFEALVNVVIEIYSIYLENADAKNIVKIIREEILKFRKNLQNGIKKIENTNGSDIDEKFAFDLMQSEGFPYEITAELAKEKGIEIDKQKFDELLKEHQELSRTSSKDKFKIK